MCSLLLVESSVKKTAAWKKPVNASVRYYRTSNRLASKILFFCLTLIFVHVYSSDEHGRGPYYFCSRALRQSRRGLPCVLRKNGARSAARQVAEDGTGIGSADLL